MRKTILADDCAKALALVSGWNENPATIPDWLVGFKTILMGMPGSGKTTSIVTAAKLGFEVFIAFTEPGMGNLMKAMQLHKLTDEERKRIHFAYIKPGVESFTKLVAGAKAVNSAAKFGEMESGSRKDFSQLIQLMNLFENFVDQHGVSFGAVDQWGPNRILALDGMSGLSKMCMDLVVGAKPVKTLQDWGVAIDQLDKFQTQCANITCPFILLSHLSREQEEVTGKIIVSLKALGNKLPTSMPFLYNDFILATAPEARFNWATIDKNCQLKATYLPHSDKLEADFRLLCINWLGEQGLI